MTTLREYLEDPSWDINDSIAMIEHHLAKLVDLGAMTPTVRQGLLFLLPDKPPLPDPPKE